MEAIIMSPIVHFHILAESRRQTRTRKGEEQTNASNDHHAMLCITKDGT